MALAVIVLRIVLEQAGAPEWLNNIFGVAWLYFAVPIFFALQIHRFGDERPFRILSLQVLLFAVYTRLMVMVTYMLAYQFQWQAPRFHLSRGGVVGEGVTPLQGLLWIPLRNFFFWVVAATVIGTILGGISLKIVSKRRRNVKNDKN